jgi:hypothetical protein
MTATSAASPAKSNKKGKKMKVLALLLALFFPSVATALTPDDVRERYPLMQRNSCTDNETGEQGICFLFEAPYGFYMVFVQQGQPVFLRRVVPPAAYETIWRATPGHDV